MPRGRWLIVAFLLAAWIVGAALNELGPFGAHQFLSYPQYLADVQAGRVASVDQWRNQLEVTELSQQFVVAVPADADVTADLAHAAMRGGAEWSLRTIPDAWLATDTPWVPLLILLAGALIWVRAVARERGRRASDPSGHGPQPAT